MSGIDLKLELVRQGRSQYAVARAAGIEPTRFNRILNGWIVPRDEELIAIRAVLSHEIDLSNGQQETRQEQIIGGA